MKCLLPLLLAGHSFLLTAVGQVSVKLELDRDQFLCGEDFILKVKITNFSGQELVLGRTKDWLAFTVGSVQGSIVSQVAEVPVEGEFRLPSSSVATKRVNLVPYYDGLSKPGRYEVTSTVRIHQWGEEFHSPLRSFNVSPGTKLWEQDVGVSAGVPGVAPFVRTYMLQQTSRGRRMILYARVSDAESGMTLRVFPLGNLVSFNRPQPQIDRTGNLHVLFQYGAKSFSHCGIDPQGRLTLRQTYLLGRGRPALRITQEGQVVVTGGMRHLRYDDIPRTRPSPTSTRLPPPPPPSSPVGDLPP